MGFLRDDYVPKQAEKNISDLQTQNAVSIRLNI